MLVSVSTLIGISIHIGWAFDIDVLRRPIATTIPSNPMSASAVILSSLCVAGLLVLHRFPSRATLLLRIIRGTSLLVALIGANALASSLGLTDRVLHLMIWHDKVVSAYGTGGGVVAPNTAFSMCCIAVSIFLSSLNKPRFLLVANYCILGSLLVAITSLLGYYYNADELYHLRNNVPMSFYTSLSVLLISFAVLLRNPHYGFISEFLKPTIGARVGRILVPLSFVLPIAVGKLYLGLGTQFGAEHVLDVALLVVIVAITQSTVVYYTIPLLNRSDAARISKELELRHMNEGLTQLVDERAREITKIEKHLEFLVEHSYETLALLNSDGEIEFVSPSVKIMSGFDARAVLHSKRNDKVHPEDRERVLAEFEKSKLSPGLPVHSMHRIIRQDLSIMWVTGTFTAFLSDNDTLQVVSNFRDITEQRNDAIELRTKNELLNLMGRTAKIGAWHVDLGSQKVSWTDELFRLHDVEPGLIPPDALEFKFFPEECRDVVAEKLKECMEKGIPFDIEYPFVSAVGTQKQVRMLGRAIMVNGKATELHGTMQDVSERSKIEHRLARTMNQVEDYKIALDESSIVAITNHQGKIIHVNENFCKISQYTAQELLGKDHRIVNSGFHSKEFFRELWRRIASGKVWHGEIRNRAKDGSLYWVDTTIVPFLDEDNKPYEYLAIRVDITERKAAEEKIRKYLEDLERSNQDLEQFAYIASHDLQEPLRMVGSYMDLVKRRYGPQLDTDGREFIDYAVEGAARMKRLINDLLQFSRINRHGTSSLVSTDNVVNQVVHNLQSAIRDSQARIEVSQLPDVYADETQVTQLFQNLIANAIKFRRNNVQPLIRVFSTHENGVDIFHVEDNGIGIQQEFQDKVFIIFKQLHDRSRYDGTGIGLAVAKRIVERYNGKIFFSSQYGQGTTFHFTIPGAASEGS